MHSSSESIAVFNNASLGIIVVNSKGIIHNINPFALNLFGYTAEEDIVGASIEILIPSRYHHNHIDHRNKYIHHPKNRPMGVGMDLFAIKKDGTEFPVEVSLGNYENDGEQNVVAFLSDITVRKKAETEIKGLNDHLETTVKQRTRDLTNTLHELQRSKEDLSKSLEKEKELGELKSRFVSMASHEFRTPLSTVLSSAYLIEKYTNTEEQQKRDKHLQRIISSVNMLTDILNDFLSIGKIEEGKIQVRFSLININESIKSIIDEIKNNLKRGQKIKYDPGGNDLYVMLDNSLLKHILLNLISNAGKFSHESGLIEVQSREYNNYLIISVKDYGIGISKEDQKHLMERFFRGTNAGNIQGTGLGLHIVSKYAELMNGIVECKSELGKGAEFLITFNTKAN